jgi:hypothetical protein
MHSGRPGAAEVRVGHRLARRLFTIRSEEHPDRRRHERVANAHLVGDLFDDAVGVGERRILDHTEHPLRLVVMRHQLGAPIGDVLPLRVVEERLRRHVQRVGVVQRSAADPRARQDHHVAQQVDPLNAVHAELGRPQELTQIPRGLGEVFVIEPAARLEHPDAVALLGEPKRGNTPPEPRTDDQNVIVRFHPNSMDLALAKF